MNVAESGKPTKRENPRTVFSNIIWIFKLFYRHSKAITLCVLVTRILLSVSPTITYYLFGVLLDKVLNIPFSEITALKDLWHKTDILQYIIGIGCFWTFDRLISYLDSYVSGQLENRYMTMIDLELYKKIASLDVQRVENPGDMNDINKATDNSWRIRTLYGNTISLFSRIIRTIASGYAIFSFSVVLGIISIILSIPRAIIAIKYIDKIWNFYNSTASNRRKAYTLRHRLGNTQSKGESYFMKTYRYIAKLSDKTWEYLFRRERAIRFEKFRNDVITSITAFLKFTTLPIYLLNAAINNKISIGQYAFFLQISNTFTNDFDSLVPDIIETWDSASYVSFIRRVFEMKNSITNGTQKLKQNQLPHIEFENVWFKYPNTKRYVLKNISIRIEPGEEIAIVGENGAGKTTFIKLLLRFYDVDKGRILINGRDIREYDLDTYYQLIGALFQDFNKFSELTVKENIILGDFEKPISINYVKKSAELADATDFIAQYDKKYDQILNKSFENGIEPSTGQWQKIALARMFYRDAPILILDEPTSSIDANAEYKIFKRIFETFHGKTLIIISHRFSTVRNAQKIYVIHNGEITEEGPHEELIKKNGRYKKAFDLQAKGYKS